MSRCASRSRIRDKCSHRDARDTAGQERYKSIVRSYYRDARLIVLVYDVTMRDSFEAISAWLNDGPFPPPARLVCVLLAYRHSVRAHNTDEKVFVLVGNKTDLRRPGKVEHVSTREGEEFASHNGLRFFETCAMRMHEVNTVRASDHCPLFAQHLMAVASCRCSSKLPISLLRCCGTSR
jgi:GTPase SAR1 family protein